MGMTSEVSVKMDRSQRECIIRLEIRMEAKCLEEIVCHVKESNPEFLKISLNKRNSKGDSGSITFISSLPLSV
jgi:hypothetical protein